MHNRIHAPLAENRVIGQHIIKTIFGNVPINMLNLWQMIA